jgi:uncharacterized protein (TIGR00375 family)
LFFADFHIHSKYSRAVSKNTDLQTLSESAKLKGLNVLGTGDFTHPVWFEELNKNLKPLGNGLFDFNGISFMLTVEVSTVSYLNEKARKVHHVIHVPSFEIAGQLNDVYSKLANLKSDGRPTFNISPAELIEKTFEVSKEVVVIPAHVFTPWFSVFGSRNGFNSVEECYEDQTKRIFALETGLSADPGMCWRLSILDKFSFVSNSDSHSVGKIGRECNAFECEVSFKEMFRSVKEKNNKKFLFTVEFFPEEGKYHFDGHRNCNFSCSPKEALKLKNKCPVCGKQLVLGVEHRIEELADREVGFVPKNAIPFKHLVPLNEIIAQALGKNVYTVGVKREFQRITTALGSELDILIKIDIKKIKETAGDKIAEGIERMRMEKVFKKPGFDGVFGEVSVFPKQTSLQTTL